MNVSPVSVAVIDKKTITKAEALRVGKDGKAAKVQAITNGKYLLTQGNDGVAPENITVKRVGKDLLVMLEGSDASEPDLIIEDFFRLRRTPEPTCARARRCRVIITEPVVMAACQSRLN